MLKDFFRNMFSEDDDDFEEEYEEEEEEEAAAPAPAPAPVIQKAAISADAGLYVEPEIQTSKTSYIHDPAMEQPAPAPEEKPVFTGLSADGKKPSKAKKGQSAYKYDRKKLAQARGTRTENPGYQAVISPIFGNMEETQKEFDKVHNAIDLPKPSADFVLVQVISPMFGNDLPGSKPVESIPAYNMNGQKEEYPANPQTDYMDLSSMLMQGNGSKKGSD